MEFKKETQHLFITVCDCDVCRKKIIPKKEKLLFFNTKKEGTDNIKKYNFKTKKIVSTSFESYSEGKIKFVIYPN